MEKAQNNKQQGNDLKKQKLVGIRAVQTAVLFSSLKVSPSV